MRKRTVLLYDLARTLYGAAAFYWFFMFFIVISELSGVSLHPAVPALGLALIYAAGYITTGKGIGFWQYAGLQALVTAAGAAFVFWCMGFGNADLKLKISTVVLYVITAVTSAVAASAEIKPGALTIRFDCCVVMCTIILIAGHYMEMPLLPYSVAMLLLAMAAIAVTLTVMRADDREGAPGAAGRAVPFVLLIIICLISGAAYLFAAGGAKKFTEALVAAVKAVAGAIGAALTFLWTQWTRFCAWLARLFPDRDFIPEVITPDQPDAVELPEAVEPSRFGIIMAWIMTSLLVLAILVAVFFALKNIRFKRKSRMRLDNRKAVRRGGLASGIRETFRKLKERLSYRIACIKYRNTAAGLLAWCESKVPRAERCRKGESGPCFLLRIAAGRAEEEEKALAGLAALVERDFYSSRKSMVPPELKAAVKRCRF